MPKIILYFLIGVKKHRKEGDPLHLLLPLRERELSTKHPPHVSFCVHIRSSVHMLASPQTRASTSLRRVYAGTYTDSYIHRHTHVHILRRLVESTEEKKRKRERRREKERYVRMCLSVCRRLWYYTRGVRTPRVVV